MQRRRVLEAVQRWGGHETGQQQLRWNARTPLQRREQQRHFESVRQRLWHPL